MKISSLVKRDLARMGVDSAEWIDISVVNYLHTIALYSNGLMFLCSRMPERNASKARAREVAFFLFEHCTVFHN